MTQNNFNDEKFEDLFNQSIGNIKSFEGNIVKGVVINVDQYYVTVDIGLKSEGKILVSEFKNQDGVVPQFEIGQEVEVYIEKYEDLDGNIILSREKAKREEVWHELEKMFAEGTPVNGFVSKRVKGGFAVTVQDVLAFLPGSQLDVRPIKNINALTGTTQLLQIIKMDKKRFNIVVSRKAIISKSNLDDAMERQEQYEEGQVVEGVVKNITGYGAFIDLGYIDGLLHVTDISWSRINHPSEVLQLGQSLQLKVIKINPENKRISLGMKQLSDDPWGEVVQKYTVGSIFKVNVTNTTDYGIFVELAKGIEGLVHISEISWVKKDINPRSDYKIGDEVEVKVLEVDVKKRRINLSIKQCTPSPWLDYANQYPEDTIVEVEVKEINDNGVVVKLNPVIEGFIRVSDLSWENKDKELLSNYKVGDKISAKIIKHNLEKDKILLSVKHLTEDTTLGEIDSLKKGDIVSCIVVKPNENGIEVEIKPGINGFIKKVDLASEIENQKLEHYPQGEKVEAMITQVNTSTRNISLSIKALDLAEQKKAMGNTDNDRNAVLADAFASAMSKKESEK